MPHCDQSVLILTPDAVFLDRDFDDPFFVRGVDQADKCGRRRLKATDFPSTLFLLTHPMHSSNKEILGPLLLVLG